MGIDERLNPEYQQVDPEIVFLLVVTAGKGVGDGGDVLKAAASELDTSSRDTFGGQAAERRRGAELSEDGAGLERDKRPQDMHCHGRVESSVQERCQRHVGRAQRIGGGQLAAEKELERAGVDERS